MTEQTNGLRFDVYERVHLPDDVAAIEESEEIELVPRIQVIAQGEQALLRGQLLLTGVYRETNNQSYPQTLEHWIPVEITLPLNRVSRLDDISVEIENFDVDLLSPRTLNVTGVLSLRGILVEPSPQIQHSWREEPFTVVHHREAPSPTHSEDNITEHKTETSPYFANQFRDASNVWHDGPEATLPEEEDESEAYLSPYSGAASGWASLGEARTEQPAIDNVSSEIVHTHEVADRIELQVQERTELEEQWAIDPLTNEQYVLKDDPAVASLARTELPTDIDVEKQQLRIGVSGKRQEEQVQDPANVGLATLLQTSKREQAARFAAEQTAAQQAQSNASTTSTGDEIEWKNLFLGKRSDENEFRKIKVCIVQRDETLDAIAVRYRLNPRELLLYNGLNESSVSEGQLIYIP